MTQAPGFTPADLEADKRKAALARRPDDAIRLDIALAEGDLSRLTPNERVTYYQRVCESVGLNPITKPFEYLRLNNKLVLYATKGCTDQLRSLRRVSIAKPTVEFADGCCIVTAVARIEAENRDDADVGVVAMGNLQGEARANAIMKAHTKAKRRVTLSICGLGMLDESEVETIRGAVPVPHDEETGEVFESAASTGTFEALCAICRDAKTLDDLRAATKEAYAAAKAQKITAAQKAEIKALSIKLAAAFAPKPGGATVESENDWGSGNGERQPGEEG